MKKWNVTNNKWVKKEKWLNIWEKKNEIVKKKWKHEKMKKWSNEEKYWESKKKKKWEKRQNVLWSDCILVVHEFASHLEHIKPFDTVR